jgi:OOP family OmpA-OmpF porin
MKNAIIIAAIALAVASTGAQGQQVRQQVQQAQQQVQDQVSQQGQQVRQQVQQYQQTNEVIRYNGNNLSHATSVSRPYQHVRPVSSQSRIVFYRVGEVNPGASTVFVNEAYHASLVGGGYAEICMNGGNQSLEAGIHHVRVGTASRRVMDSATVLSTKQAQNVFLRVREVPGNPGATALVPVDEATARNELAGARLQQHTISRVVGATPCQYAADVPAPAPAAPQIITLQADALFAFGKSGINDLTGAGRGALDKLIADLRSQYATVTRLHIVGHADPIGNAASNQRLSEARAITVREYLTRAGLNAQMTSEGRGSREPVATCGTTATNANIACNAPNRRVTVEVTGTK